MTIKEAAIKILAQGHCSMSVSDICEKIIDLDLYDFGAKSPKSVLRIELARSSVNLSYSKPYKVKYFKHLENSTFELLKETN